jgi:sugar phosphate isomerase/epimerase
LPEPQIETLNQAFERLRGSGVTLAIEDFGVYPNFTASGAHCLETLEASGCPDIKFVFDNGNFLLGGDTPVHAYSLLSDRTVHVHVKDFISTHPDDPKSLPSPSGRRYKI